MVPYAATIFLSAFLLFTIEPLIAKRILPWFGGSSAVWATCLVFYQVALLLGYWYAQLSTRYLAALFNVSFTQCCWEHHACCFRLGRANAGFRFCLSTRRGPSSSCLV